MLSYLLALRLVFLLQYGTRGVLTELDRQMWSPSIKAEGVLPSSEKDKEKEKDSDGPSDGPAREGRKCWLCIDQLKQPAALPCGHIFCWACIFELRSSSSSSSKSVADSVGLGSLACPVCRALFLPQKVRALYGY